jgi:hypothetical protein
MLGMGIDKTPQPIAQNQSLYFPNSFALKQELDKIKVRPTISLFNYGAIEMYPSIPIDRCINRMDNWFNKSKQVKWFTNTSVDVLMDAINLIMSRNRMKC